MTKELSAAGFALKLRQFMNQENADSHLVTRALVILGNKELHHLLGSEKRHSKGRAEGRKRDHEDVGRSNFEVPMNKGVEEEEYCKT
jgi:hypothetical protein